ncbi:MAG: PAS domain S-box protein [Syntrophobacteraceae bacterium]
MVWDRTNRPLWFRCAVGVLVVFIAAAIRLLFLEILELRATFVVFFPAVAVAALYGGLGAGLLATVVSTALAHYFWMVPVGQFGIKGSADLMSMAVFLAGGALVSYLAEATYSAQARAYKAEELSRLAAEREKAAVELQQSESKYRELVQNANSAIIRWKRDGTLTFFNEYAQKFFGYSAEEVIGKSVNILVPEQPAGGSLTRLVQDIVNHPERYASNISENILRNGGRVWMAWTNKPVLDQEGQVLEILAVGSDITERKRAEEALSLRESYLSSILENQPGLVWLKDKEGRFLAVNRAFALSCGMERPEEVLGKTDLDIWPGELAEKYRNDDKAVLTKGAPIAVEESISDRGEMKWFETFKTPVLNKDGQILGTSGFARDITERKRTEEELRRLNRILRALSNTNQAAIHAEGVSDFLDAVCRIIVEDCGHPMVWIGFAEDDENKTVKPVAQAGFEEGYLDTIKITWSDTELGRGPTGTAVRTGTPDVCMNMQTEIRMRPWREQAIKRGYASSVGLPLKTGGQTSGVLTIYSKEPDSFSGDEVKLLAELADDLAYGITVLKLRLAHQQSEQKLRENRFQLDLALRSAGMGTWHWDITGNRRYFDDQACYLFGIDPTTFTGDAEEVFAALHPDDREIVRKALARTLERDVPYQAEYRAAWPDGSVHYIASRGKLVRDDEGRPVRLNGLIWDISERRRMEEELRKSRDDLELRVGERTAELSATVARLELVNAELREFAFVASHDLQEPLRKIQTFCDMAQKRCAPVLDSTSKDYLDRVINSATRMRQLLSDLLQFSRAATKPEPFEKIDLVKIVREAADVFEKTVKNTGALVDIESMPAIEADESQMLRLFQNLIGNALKFRSKEIPKVKVYGKLVGRGLCEIVIEDNGIGFDPQFAELIFKPFQRLHNRNEYEGTGMGLAICRKIVERHGGSIRAESEPGKGSTFIITLPVKQDRWKGI